MDDGDDWCFTANFVYKGWSMRSSLRGQLDWVLLFMCCSHAVVDVGVLLSLTLYHFIADFFLSFSQVSVKNLFLHDANKPQLTVLITSV